MAPELIGENKQAESLLRFLRGLLPRSLLRRARPPYHFLLSLAAALLYRIPGKRMIVAGVTGTKGKSTVVEMARIILQEAGMHVASLSSLRYWIGDDSWPNTLKMTVPGRFKLQGFLRHARDKGSTHMVLEMTSEGIAQSRHRFIRYEVVAITNLHPEHIEAHGSFEAYRNAKAKLFRATRRTHVLNADDEHFSFFRQFPAARKILYSLQPQPALKLRAGEELLCASDIRVTASAAEFQVGDQPFRMAMTGRFNVSNALCAIAIGRALGAPLGTAQKALARFEKPEGRLECIDEGQIFGVVVDFAHTPDSLRAVYETVKELRPGAEIIAVLGGTGGGRDKWKRPLMGEIALRYARKVFFTNEDPYDEDPAAIIEEVAKGSEKVPEEKRIFEKILDRKEAIRKAVHEATLNDTIVITGKGGEQWMVLRGGEKTPWSDSEIVREAIKERIKKASSIPL